MPELIEAVALAMMEDGVHSYKTCGREVIEAAEHRAAATCTTVLSADRRHYESAPDRALPRLWCVGFPYPSDVRVTKYLVSLHGYG